ncbi:MAG: hypothetical protein IBX72_14010 [Nitrospirae bacterium]|jgi:hypothetical protein|nr:hypothetical protein [Nitrospirota bacterium]
MSIKTFIKIIISVSVFGTILCSSKSNAEKIFWKQYYEDSLASYFYNEESLKYPYEDNQNIIAVQRKTVPNVYLTESKKEIGYFMDLIYMNCETVRYSRKEILTYDVSDELITRQIGRSTYYSISPESEEESLYKKICP